MVVDATLVAAAAGAVVGTIAVGVGILTWWETRRGNQASEQARKDEAQQALEADFKLVEWSGSRQGPRDRLTLVVVNVGRHPALGVEATLDHDGGNYGAEGAPTAFVNPGGHTFFEFDVATARDAPDYEPRPFYIRPAHHTLYLKFADGTGSRRQPLKYLAVQ